MFIISLYKSNVIEWLKEKIREWTLLCVSSVPKLLFYFKKKEKKAKKKKEEKKKTKNKSEP
jgi:23S rRNA G2445 N2-methylase RlmL